MTCHCKHAKNNLLWHTQLTIQLGKAYATYYQYSIHVIFTSISTGQCHLRVTYIDQTLVNLLHGLLNFEIGGLDCRVITTERI